MTQEERSAKFKSGQAQLEEALKKIDPSDHVNTAICQVMLMTSYLHEGLTVLHQGLDMLNERVKRLEPKEVKHDR